MSLPPTAGVKKFRVSELMEEQNVTPGVGVLDAPVPRRDRKGAGGKPARTAGRMRGFGTVDQRGRIWWIAYW